eukprot:TRINITY_DN62901_c0_g1_i1.p1 TRINITY_DN62901_c0_g1~~TRINITY_DN62901_c0_g1_i1.p1  ORF type:complete len:375 (+),score=94.12 TRINITY_DN62901_c0_g1_i1:3-1127(+)
MASSPASGPASGPPAGSSSSGDEERAAWSRLSLRNTFRVLSDWGDDFERRHFDGNFLGAVSSTLDAPRQAVEQQRQLISQVGVQASRLGGELGSAAAKLVEEAAGISSASQPSSPTPSYFEAPESELPEGRGTATAPAPATPPKPELTAPSAAELWEEVRALQEELLRERELRRGRQTALTAQDECLRRLRGELLEGRRLLQESLEGRQCAEGRLDSAERGLEALQDAHSDLQQLRHRREAELRRLAAAAAQAAREAAAEAAKVAATPGGSAASWARDGPEMEALKAAKVELAEILAESDEVRLQARRESTQLQRQLEGAQAENLRLGGLGEKPAEMAGNSLPCNGSNGQAPGRFRSMWRLLTTARSDDQPAVP